MQAITPVMTSQLLDKAQKYLYKCEVVEDTTELLADGGLENWNSATDLVSWAETVTAGSTVNREATTKIAGNYSCRLDIDASNNAAGIYAAVQLYPDEEYTASFWYKIPAGKTAIFWLVDTTWTIGLHSDGTWAGGVYGVTITGTGEWEKYWITFDGPPDTYANYYFYIANTNAASSSIYLDELSLVRNEWLDLSAMPSQRDDVLAGWRYRKEIDISGEYIDAALTDFPVCVVIDHDPDIGSAALASGYDIRFTAEDGQALLKYEREAFAITDDMATGVFWIKVPALTSAGAKLYIYWGNTDATDGAEPTAVWDEYFGAVWHLNDATTSTVFDATAGNNDGTKTSANNPAEVDGRIGKGQHFDFSENISVGSASGVQGGTGDMTWEAWAKFDVEGNVIFDSRNFTGAVWQGYLIGWGPTAFWLVLNDNCADQKVAAHFTPAAVGEWLHFSLSWNRAGMGATFYINGEPVVLMNTLAMTGTLDSDAPCRLGYDAGHVSDLIGYLDEARITKGLARSAAWIKFTYRNMAEADNCLSFGSAEDLEQSYIKSMSCQVAGAGKNTEPIAGSWSVTINNESGIFHPYHPTSEYAGLLQLGRKARLSWGIKYDPYYDDNELIDGALEIWASATDLTNWAEDISGGSSINREASVIHEGTYSARMDDGGAGAHAGIYQTPVWLVAGVPYDFSFWYKTIGALTARLWVYAGPSFSYSLEAGEDGLPTWGSGAGRHIHLPATYGEWVEHHCVFTTHPDHDQYLFSVSNDMDTSINTSVYFDDLKVRRHGLEAEIYWQRIIGFMDTPRFDAGSNEVAISGSDYSKVLIDTKLFSPWTNWGTYETFDSIASPGGTGSEYYDEADACEIGAGEANNVTPWSCPTGSVSSVSGTKSSYALRYQKASDHTSEYTTNTNVASLTAGLQYHLGLWGRALGAGRAGINLRQNGAQIASKTFTTASWVYYELDFTATYTGALELRAAVWGIHSEAGDAVEIDEITLKLFDSDSWGVYDLDPSCNGVYYVTLDGEPLWQGDEDGQGGWHYNPEANTLEFSEGLQIEAGTDNLLIYYYTDTVLEDVVADLLVAGGLYANRAAAKAAMNYTATGITLEKVWFEAGTTAMAALQMLCERANYRFWFDQDGAPNFHPAPTRTTPSDFILTSVGQASGLTLYQDIEEVRNHITIEGCQRSVLSVSTQQVEQSTWKGDAHDDTSIAAYQEKTHALSNHLFQDQGAIDDMCTGLLAYYKDPKFYLDLTTNFLPAPLEVGDTITVLIPLTPVLSVSKYAIIRGINLSNGEAKYLCEISVAFNTVLVVQDATMGLTAEHVELEYSGELSVQEATMGLAAENVVLEPEIIYEYTTVQAGTELAVPTGYTQAILECWGDGGNGGNGEMVNQAGGGGGGGYSKKTLTGLTASDKLYIYLPAVGTGNPTEVNKNGTSTVCLATAGQDGDVSGYGAGGAGTVGDVGYTGGHGYYYSSGYTGGGGGGCAGTGSNGNNATTWAGATAVTGGGPGGPGGARFEDGDAPGSGPGGGGGGAGEDLDVETYGGAGWIGKVKITFRP